MSVVSARKKETTSARLRLRGQSGVVGAGIRGVVIPTGKSPKKFSVVIPNQVEGDVRLDAFGDVTERGAVEIGLSVPDAVLAEPELARGEGPLSEDERGLLVMQSRLKARKLARSILRRWHARLDQQEVDSVVDLSLCEAVRRFNPNKGASFMTFMYFHLRGNLIRSVAGAVQDSAIPAFEDGEHTGYAAEKDESSTSQAQAKAPKISDIVTALYGDDHALPDDIMFDKQVVMAVSQAKARLDGLEREVIEQLYFQERQLLDIADTLGYSRCHISRVKKRAIQVLGDELSKVLPHLKRRELDATEEALGDTFGDARRSIRRRRPRSKKSAVVTVQRKRAFG